MEGVTFVSYLPLILVFVLFFLRVPAGFSMILASILYFTFMNDTMPIDLALQNLITSIQDFNLLDTLTAYENIALALTIMGEKPKAILQHVKMVAETLDITDVLKKYPYEMSGGQKQRVACARAIIHNPKLILADEPTGALDSRAARLLLQSFERLNFNLGATIMMVTHDAFTASYCKRILFIKDGRVFNELIRGEMDRKTFFERIIEVETLLGGDMSNVL